MSERTYIAVDLGAESGRIMLGTCATAPRELDQTHRFADAPIEVDGPLRWDFRRLFYEARNGIGETVKAVGGEVVGIGVDTWGVDFGLIGDDGKLIENPYQYTATRTPEDAPHLVYMPEAAFSFEKLIYVVQADYRWLKTANSNAAFGYNFEGPLQHYAFIVNAFDINTYVIEIKRLIIFLQKHLRKRGANNRRVLDNIKVTLLKESLMRI